MMRVFPLILLLFASFSAQAGTWESWPILNSVLNNKFSQKYENSLDSKAESNEKIIVAVIDSGVDINHMGLNKKIWINKNEIPNNGIDDDYNGYIDDIVGWNFIGHYSGNAEFSVNRDSVTIDNQKPDLQIKYENLEITRSYNFLAAKENKSPQEIEKQIEYERLINNKLARAGTLIQSYERELKAFESACKILNVDKNDISTALLNSLSPQSEIERSAFLYLKDVLTIGTSFSFIQEELQRFKVQRDFHYNINLNQRAQVVQDEDKIRDKNYGNNDVKGPLFSHGTAVAGVIAKQTESALIMPLRVVPDGDELDKDVVNAIYYAVDNGAQIINMSFGKYLSSHPKEVFEAMEYAERAGVIIILAAGNDYSNIDVNQSFPSAKYNERKLHNVIVVGASNPNDQIALFSNYGENSLTLLAPGVDIESLAADDDVSTFTGTSLAAPQVSFAVAEILNQFPELHPEAMIHVLQQGATPTNPSTTRGSIITHRVGILNLFNTLKILKN